MEKRKGKGKVDGPAEKKDEANSKDVEKKKEEASLTVVYKVDFHCQGCTQRLFKSARSFKGVETVKKTDKDRLTVTGLVDPTKLLQSIRNRSGKHLELISPLPKKSDDKKSDEKKSDEKKKEPAVTTTVLKMHLHCEGCVEKIEKVIRKTKGVYDVKIDREKEQVTVKGEMDVKVVQERLKVKMKRASEIVPPKKDEKKSEEKKDKEKKSGAEFVEVKFGYDQYGFFSGPYCQPVKHCHCCSYPPPCPPPDSIFSDENPNACRIM